MYKDAIVSALCGEGFCVEKDRAMELLREVCGEMGASIHKDSSVKYGDVFYNPKLKIAIIGDYVKQINVDALVSFTGRENTISL